MGSSIPMMNRSIFAAALLLALSCSVASAERTPMIVPATMHTEVLSQPLDMAVMKVANGTAEWSKCLSIPKLGNVCVDAYFVEANLPAGVAMSFNGHQLFDEEIS